MLAVVALLFIVVGFERCVEHVVQVSIVELNPSPRHYPPSRQGILPTHLSRSKPGTGIGDDEKVTGGQSQIVSGPTRRLLSSLSRQAANIEPEPPSFKEKCPYFATRLDPPNRFTG